MAARRALIVATGSYADPKLRRLRAPAADADKLAAVLKNPQIGNFEVDVALDQSESELRRRLARFTRDARRDDVLLFHFSCHGIKDDHGELYLAASDTELDLPDATAISAAWLSDQISRSPSRRTLLLLDCCFSGRFPLGATARGGDKVDVQDRFEGRGRAVISASNAMEYAYEGDDLTGEGRPSYFTQAVIDGLETGQADRDHDHRISVDELYDYVFERVKEMS
ncbi:MAG: caspase family protein, partial [Mycobacteriaceae bacterium]|nr:caspase family protein [Mycobacteriaceae bacterium]